jgi:hypothetical protein
MMPKGSTIEILQKFKVLYTWPPSIKIINIYDAERLNNYRSSCLRQEQNNSTQYMLL